MSAVSPVLDRLDKNLDQSLERLFGLLRIKSISTDPAYAADCRKAAEWLVAELKLIGFDASVRDTPGHPMVVAHHEGPAGAPHVLFYGHYDVQPVDPIELWENDPFAPAIKQVGPDHKVITGRGSADDKGQLMTFVEACRAWKQVHGNLPCRVTILFEGEEESGSPSLKPFLEANAAELSTDFALVCDTGMWDRETPSICVSLRGMVGEEVTVKAADRDLHSGLYGGAAANPIRILAKVLADIHDKDGHITIPGFYDGVEETPSQVLKSWESLGETAETFLGPVGLSIPSGEKGRSVLGAADGRVQRHHWRLYRQGIQDGDRGGSLGQGIIPPRPQTGPEGNPCCVSGVRAGTYPGRLLGRIPPAWRLAGDPAFLRLAVPGQGQGRTVGRMGETGGHDRQWRINPGCRRFPDLSRYRVTAGRLRPRRRPHPLAQ